MFIEKRKEVTKDNIRRDSGGSLTLKKKFLWNPVQITQKRSWMKENVILSVTLQMSLTPISNGGFMVEGEDIHVSN